MTPIPRAVSLGSTAPAATLNLAHVGAWSHRTDAAEFSKRYLHAQPDQATAWIELARTDRRCSRKLGYHQPVIKAAIRGSQFESM